MLLPVTLAVWLSACHRWVPVDQPEVALRQAATGAGSGTYRVHVNGGETVEGKLTEAKGDSVIIQTANRSCCRSGGELESTSVALEAVERAEVEDNCLS